ncbi:hypothetical protein E4T56_gene5398 [Termitomyces sp. T112]|nr:hypothetical protein E4T56_gene5398 [Termitomyces sp. T112]
MFTRTYYPTTAGSIVVPNTAASVVMPTTNYPTYPTSYPASYASSAYATVPTVPMSAPVMVPSFHRPAPVVVPTTQHYGYATPLPYYNTVAPTVVMSSSHRSKTGEGCRGNTGLPPCRVRLGRI